MKEGLLRFFYRIIYWYYKKVGRSEHDVKIRSEVTKVEFGETTLPLRTFTALTKVRLPMGRVEVMPGHYQVMENHYSIMYGLQVKRLYRRRKIATKLINSVEKFCIKEGFGELVTVVKKNNLVGLSLMLKNGFLLIEEHMYAKWMKSEAQYKSKDTFFLMKKLPRMS